MPPGDDLPHAELYPFDRVHSPISLAVGAAFLILADVPGRMLQNPAETPIGVVTAFCGAPFFIVLLRSRRSTV